MRKKYPSDITRDQFDTIRPLLESARLKTRPREPNVVEVRCQGAGSALDVLAKVSDDRKTLVLYVVNVEPKEIQSELRLIGFTPKQAWMEQIHGQLADFNTEANPTKVSPVCTDVPMESMRFSFRAYSFTVIKFAAAQAGMVSTWIMPEPANLRQLVISDE